MFILLGLIPSCCWIIFEIQKIPYRYRRIIYKTYGISNSCASIFGAPVVFYMSFNIYLTYLYISCYVSVSLSRPGALWRSEPFIVILPGCSTVLSVDLVGSWLDITWILNKFHCLQIAAYFFQIKSERQKSFCKVSDEA